ncbi:MAG TPA: 1-(5-phosphoribosyl)-5-[(5-phosphoribosylamino)methylideneamino] imidazole-4-carboxamide isomerase [Synergistetes bacterium]|nr:1-(5-phosphoribosyl)-5-[(5-phosphoribosylamino)methylideneamino] imidazole-4-carboxamide isomerase [Synergistota bacterium]
MVIFPAIDLLQGKVSRLLKGSFESCVYYSLDPVETAACYAKLGCTHLHVVDLDGARTGRPVHENLLRELAPLGLFLQYGGGLRNMKDIESILVQGASRVMTGSFAFSRPSAAKDLRRAFGKRVLPALDIKDGRAAVKGWLSLSGYSLSDALSHLAEAGFEEALVTSVERDGTLSGPKFDLYASIIRNFPNFSVIAAGGISEITDISKLSNLGCSGVVLGKSIYEKRIDLGAVLRMTRECSPKE